MPWPGEAVRPDVLASVLDQDPAHIMMPSDYWECLKPLLPEFGISRVADITGLDHIGYPVAQAVRPAARSNAVTQGKAATLQGAAVGAVLECLEMAAGEALERLPEVAVQDRSEWRTYAPDLGADQHWPDADTAFIACRDLCAEADAAIPRDLISTDFRRDAPAAAAPILRHSVGLGAGTTPAAAVLHGLLESIEADARTRDMALGGARRLALTQDDPTYGPLLGQVESAGLRVAVYALPCKGGVACVQASVMEEPGMTHLPLPAVGYGARFTYCEAIRAALSEAVQARLAVISGAREDLTQSVYAHGLSSAALDAEWHRHGRDPFAQPPQALPRTTLREIAETCAPIYAVPLVWLPQIPLYIVRIVAPNLIADPLRLVAV